MVSISSIASKIDCTRETLRTWVRRAERDAGKRAGLTTDERQRLKELERENRELKRANESQGVGVFRPGGARPPTEVNVLFVDANRENYGVEPICRMLPIAPSTYYEQKAREKDPSRLMSNSAARFIVYGKRTLTCMACARSGVSCAVRAATWLDARWPV